MSERDGFRCVICDTQEPHFSWTDTHGVAQCQCGTPYRVYHYEGDKRVEKPPEHQLAPEWVEKCRAYWKETGRTIPGGFSFSEGYERASQDDIRRWNEYWEAREAK